MQQAGDRACSILKRTCLYRSQAAEKSAQSIWEEISKNSGSETL